MQKLSKINIKSTICLLNAIMLKACVEVTHMACNLKKCLLFWHLLSIGNDIYLACTFSKIQHFNTTAETNFKI